MSDTDTKKKPETRRVGQRETLVAGKKYRIRVFLGKDAASCGAPCYSSKNHNIAKYWRRVDTVLYYRRSRAALSYPLVPLRDRRAGDRPAPVSADYDYRRSYAQQNKPPTRHTRQPGESMPLTNRRTPAFKGERLAYRIKDIIALTGLSRSTIERDIREGNLKTIRIRGTIVIPAQSAREYLSLPQKENADQGESVTTA